MVNWFGRYDQITPSLDKLISGLTSLRNSEHITFLGSELALVLTR